MKSKVAWKEIKELNTAELKTRYNDLQKELLNLRIEKASAQLKNPLKIRTVRRNIARVLTVMQERGK